MSREITKHAVEQATRRYNQKRLKRDQKRFDDAPLKWNLMAILLDLWLGKSPYRYVFNCRKTSMGTEKHEKRLAEHDREIIALTRDLGLVHINTSYRQASHPHDPYVVWLMLTPLGYRFCSEHFKDPERLKYLWKAHRLMKSVAELFAWLSVVVTIYALIANFCLSAVLKALDVDLGLTPTSASYGVLTGFAIGFVILTLIAAIAAVYFKFAWSHNRHARVSRKSLLTYILTKTKGKATYRDVNLLGLEADVAFDMRKQ